MRLGFVTRVNAAVAVLLLLFGGAMAALGLNLARERHAKALQQLSAPLAGHVVANWPVVSAPRATLRTPAHGRA